MASTYYDSSVDRWRVRWLEDGRRRGRKFKTQREALAFAATLPPTSPRKISRTRSEVIALLASHSALTDSGCMEWQSELTNAGYGRMSWRDPGIATTVRGAHRIAYHLLVKSVDPRLVIDHLFRNRACVRPDRLDLVTSRENIMRSPIAPGAINATKTQCPQGHTYSPENTYRQRNGGRLCKACQRARRAARR